MRRIVVTEFISLDGVIEDPGGAEDFKHGGWSFKFQDPEGAKYKLDEVMEHDALLATATLKRCPTTSSPPTRRGSTAT
jgi:hypothetical protein